MSFLITNIFSRIICIVLIFIVCPMQTLAATNVEWILLKENNLGKQWIDKGSLKKYKNNEISVLTKFFENPINENRKGTTSLYVMRINCENNNFKDTSINGLPNLNSKWRDYIKQYQIFHLNYWTSHQLGILLYQIDHFF